ncbi:hypothetical protein HYALB_00005474 [Hymenoscyphus albidus]|uniref:Uncharacterized protein n=1 Tax=Hymenoscyphus albidus TaxID=595503 RepID=A0A9N9QDS0_9HELO|nr:hypothetical protein HYALB_00005474 [Hymenoscyphus albidus]
MFYFIFTHGVGPQDRATPRGGEQKENAYPGNPWYTSFHTRPGISGVYLNRTHNTSFSQFVHRRENGDWNYDTWKFNTSAFPSHNTFFEFLSEQIKNNVRGQKENEVKKVLYDTKLRLKKLHPTDCEGYNIQDEAKRIKALEKGIADRNFQNEPSSQMRYQEFRKLVQENGDQACLEVERGSIYAPIHIKGASEMIRYMLNSIPKEKYLNFRLEDKKASLPETPLVCSEITHEHSCHLLDRDGKTFHLLAQNAGNWLNYGITFADAKENDKRSQAFLKEYIKLERLWPGPEEESRQSVKDKRFPAGSYVAKERERYKGTTFGHCSRHTGLWTEKGQAFVPNSPRGEPWNLQVTKTTAGRTGDGEAVNKPRMEAVRRWRRTTIYHQAIIGFLYNVIDPTKFQEDQVFVQGLAERKLLAVYHPMQCHILQVVQCNRACGWHRDNGDVKNTMVGTTTFGTFGGGHYVLTDCGLDIRVPVFPGDYSIIRATKTGHAVTPILYGQRLASPLLEKEGKTLSMLQNGNEKDRGNFYKLTMLEHRKTKGTANKFIKAKALKEKAIKEAEEAQNQEKLNEIKATPIGFYYNYQSKEQKRVDKGKFPFMAR